MAMEMPKINNCDDEKCSYNMSKQCHAIAITVGDGEGCPICDTSIELDQKSGVRDMTGGIGACKESACQFNKSLECTAEEGVQVNMHSDHAECATFKSD